MTDACRRPEISGSRSCAVSRSHIPCNSRPLHGLAIAACASSASATLAPLAPVPSRCRAATPAPIAPGANAGGDAGARALDATHAIGATEFLLQAGIVVARAASMRRIVLPMLDAGAAIAIDGSAAPVDAAAAPVTPAAPVSATLRRLRAGHRVIA